MACDKGYSEGCWCHLEWHCEHSGIARVFGGGQEYGDVYCYALPFVVRDRYPMPIDEQWGRIEFVGVTVVMRPCQYRCMRAAMRNAGWGILSTRVKNGVSRTIEICKRG